ncbi:unnamed protein product [Malus baccata var. baccata]
MQSLPALNLQLEGPMMIKMLQNLNNGDVKALTLEVQVVERLPHNIIAASLLVAWESWAKIPKETKKLVNYDLKVISPAAIAYLEETLATRYKHWKCNLHAHFKKWDDPEIAHLEGCPIELLDWPEDWEWLCKHFTDPKFVEGSKFPEINMFKDVYAAMVEKRTTVLQEATSQLPPGTLIEDIILPEDTCLQILTEVLNPKLDRRHGKVVRCMGKVRMSDLQILMPAPDLAPPSTSQPLHPADT